MRASSDRNIVGCHVWLEYSRSLSIEIKLSCGTHPRRLSSHIRHNTTSRNITPLLNANGEGNLQAKFRCHVKLAHHSNLTLRFPSIYHICPPKYIVCICIDGSWTNDAITFAVKRFSRQNLFPNELLLVKQLSIGLHLPSIVLQSKNGKYFRF